MFITRSSLTQLAYIVKPGTLDAALHHWVNVMRAGPFFTGIFPLRNQIFRGKPTNQDAVVACGYHGDVQIELIDATSEAPGVYSEFLASHGVIPVGGLYHHVMIDDGDFDATIARLESSGCPAVFTATTPDGLGRLAYLDAREATGGYLEVLDSATWPTLAAAMKQASANWDGTHPVRTFGELTGV